MGFDGGEQIAEDSQYRCVRNRAEDALLFEWKSVPDLSVADFQRGLVAFAEQCKARKPARTVIDATSLDVNSPALAWVSGQQPGDDPYLDWWTRELVPAYNEAGFARLGVATGNPNAPGRAVDVPPGAAFQMGYFSDLPSADRWATAVD